MAAMPIAVPIMPFSESGVSITRSLPNFASRPSVTLNTPPSTPTSSPRTTMDLSRSISCFRHAFIASTMFIFIIITS